MNKQKNEDMFNITINYIINSYEKNNNDGYFIAFRTHNNNKIYSIRTLDYEEYIDFVLRNKNKISSSEAVLGHLRMATHGYGEEWVHGWKFGKYYCIHNGVLQHEHKEFENDSYQFFYNIFRKKQKIENTNGYGVMIMSDLQKQTIIVSIHKTAYFHYLNDSVITVVSQNDIHDFKNEVTIPREREEKTKFGDIEFKRTIKEKQKVKLENFTIQKDMQYSNENFVVVFSHKKQKFRIKKIEPKEKEEKEEKQNKLERFRNYYYNYRNYF